MKKVTLFSLSFLISASLSMQAHEPHYLAEYFASYRTIKNKLKKIITEQNTVLFFYSDCCASCVKESLLVDDLAARLPELTFVKINMREYKDIAASYNVTEPTFIFFQDNKEIERFIPKDDEDEDSCDTCITYKEDQIMSIINKIYN